MVVGLLVGTGVALLVGGVLEAFLVGLGARDPAVYSVAMATLAGTAAVAAFVPARGAARVDPVTALKESCVELEKIGLEDLDRHFGRH